MCLECDSGYHMSSNGVCYNEIEECSTYSGNYCVACMFPYEINDELSECSVKCG